MNLSLDEIGYPPSLQVVGIGATQDGVLPVVRSRRASSPSVFDGSDGVAGYTACHVGANAHAAAPATVRVSGMVDCRSCHDAQQHPGFDPEAAWLRIQHGQER